VSAKKRGVPTREWLASLNKWVSQCFQTQPLWRVRTPQRHWFCPYCGRAAFKAAPDGDLVRLISNHLAQQCEPFEEIGAVSIFNYAGLQARALPLRIKGWLGSTPAWRVRDHRERWVCPYCIRTTEASLAVWDANGPVGSHKNKVFQPQFHACEECKSKHHVQLPRFPSAFQSIQPASKGLHFIEASDGLPVPKHMLSTLFP